MLLVNQDNVTRVAEADVESAETLLRDAGAEGTVVNLAITDDGDNTFTVWMGIDPAQPMNSKARRLIADLSAMHILCFGPVVVTGLDEDMEREVQQ